MKAVIGHLALRCEKEKWVKVREELEVLLTILTMYLIKQLSELSTSIQKVIFA